MKKETSLDKSRKMAEAALEETNAKIEELGLRSSRLYDALGAIQDRSSLSSLCGRKLSSKIT